MDLKQAIYVGGTEWRESYPVICQMAVTVLIDDKVEAEKPMLTRQLQDTLISEAEAPDNAHSRISIYNALTNNTQVDRPMELYHSRVSGPDPARPGKTRMAYVWHMPSVKAQVASLEAKRDYHRGEVTKANAAIDKLQGDT